jgi:chorismate mutase
MLELATLRKEIDALDETIQRALMKRGELVAQIYQAKGGKGSAFFPAREAQMMQMFVDRHEGNLPVELIVQLYRQIISTFIRLQANFAVHLLPKDREKARFHFGFGGKFQDHDTAKAAILAVDSSERDCAFLSFYKPKSAWWLALEEPSAPKIVSLFPPVLKAGEKLEACIISTLATPTDGLAGELVSVTCFSPQKYEKALTSFENEMIILKNRDEPLTFPFEIASQITIGYTALPVRL